MKKTIYLLGALFSLASTASAVNWTAGSSNTYTNGISQDNTFMLGATQNVNNTAATANASIMTFGFQNTITNSVGTFVMGRSNQGVNAGTFNLILGDTNVINSTVIGGARNCYLLGTSLNVKPTVDFACLTVLGVLNKEIPLSGTSATDEGVLLVVGNGNTVANVRSNAMVMQKSGRTVFTNRNYIAPIAGQARPVQPETLVVQGAVTVEGDMTLNKRQGDIWMGGFGRTEDQGPAN